MTKNSLTAWVLKISSTCIGAFYSTHSDLGLIFHSYLLSVPDTGLSPQELQPLINLVFRVSFGQDSRTRNRTRILAGQRTDKNTISWLIFERNYNGGTTFGRMTLGRVVLLRWHFAEEHQKMTWGRLTLATNGILFLLFC